MLIITKGVYTIISLIKIAFYLKNPQAIIELLIRKNPKFCFRQNICLYILQLIDLIVINDTIIKDEYKLSQLNNPKYIIDVGAGIGELSVYAGKKYPHAKIVSIEPNKKVFELMLKNLNLNNIKNVAIHNIAIGNEPSYQMYIPKYHIQGSTIKPAKYGQKIKVKAQRLNDFINNTVDLLKIDCEGAELDILSSIDKDNFKKIKNIAIEYHNNLVSDIKQMVIDLLLRYNFKTILIEDKINPGTGYIYAKK